MKSRTLCFAPGRITPGMVLAKAVIDHEGKTLLTQGTVFSLEIIDRLLRRGVEAVSVLIPDSRSDEMIAEEMRLVSTRVDAIFRHPGSAAREELRAAILGFRQEITR